MAQIHQPVRTTRIRAPQPAGPAPVGIVLAALSLATAVGGSGLAAGGTAGALLAARITGSDAAAGVPLGVLVVGSATSAMAISWHTGRAGRASGLALGYAVGALGGGIVILGAVASSFAAVLVGSFLLGAANSAVFLTRYAAAQLGGEQARGRALGVALSATALGAVASPNLLGPAGSLATALRLPELTGLYLVAVPAFLFAALVLTGLSRPRVPVLGRPVTWVRAAGRPVTWVRTPGRPVTWVRTPGGPAGLGLLGAVSASLRLPAARLALFVLAAANLVMVSVMAVAPLAITHHGHQLGLVGFAVSLHVLCMFAPSPVTGWLADRAGGATVAGLGAAVLLAGGLASLAVDLHSGWQVIGVLAVVGLGWNCGVVGGSALLIAVVPASIRPHAEGLGEVAMGAAAAVGAATAGLAIAFGGFAALGAGGAIVGLTVLAVLIGR